MPSRAEKVVLFGVLATLTLLLAGCGASPRTASTPPSATVTPSADALRQKAEARYLSRLSQPLAELLRAQPWFQAFTPPALELVAAIAENEPAARAKGQDTGPRTLIQIASEQPWYQDGLDEREAQAMTGLFLAYTESLADENAPYIGHLLRSTLQHGLFDVVALPQSGRLVLLVSADDASEGRRALVFASELAGPIEALVGAYPYKFLHLQITADLPPGVAGASYDQFIWLHPRYIDPPTVAHEITHSMVYGLFPSWFEEGLAHLVEHHVTDTMAQGVASFKDDLALLKRDVKIDMRTRVRSDADAYSERAQGFLLLNDLYDAVGLEAFSATSAGPARRQGFTVAPRPGYLQPRDRYSHQLLSPVAFGYWCNELMAKGKTRCHEISYVEPDGAEFRSLQKGSRIFACQGPVAASRHTVRMFSR